MALKRLLITVAVIVAVVLLIELVLGLPVTWEGTGTRSG
jgi:hypothetical protein